MRYQRELDAKYAQRSLNLENDFFQKLKLMENELRSSQSKEATIATIYQQLRDSTQIQLDDMLL